MARLMCSVHLRSVFEPQSKSEDRSNQVTRRPSPQPPTTLEPSSNQRRLCTLPSTCTLHSATELVCDIHIGRETQQLNHQSFIASWETRHPRQRQPPTTRRIANRRKKWASNRARKSAAAVPKPSRRGTPAFWPMGRRTRTASD